MSNKEEIKKGHGWCHEQLFLFIYVCGPHVIKVSNILFLQCAFPVCAQMSMGHKKMVAL